MDAQRQAKHDLRQAIISQRDAMSEIVRSEASRLIRARLLALPVVQAAESLFIFISYASEVDTHPLIDTLLESRRRLAVPKIIDKTTMLSVPLKSWEQLQPGTLGILSPTASDRDDGPFDVVITPGVAFTECGDRLGYGRGYYDRWFAQYIVGTKVALAFEAQIVDSLPTDESDIPVDLIVTEKRVIRPRAKI